MTNGRPPSISVLVGLVGMVGAAIATAAETDLRLIDAVRLGNGQAVRTLLESHL